MNRVGNEPINKCALLVNSFSASPSRCTKVVLGSPRMSRSVRTTCPTSWATFAGTPPSARRMASSTPSVSPSSGREISPVACASIATLSGSSHISTLSSIPPLCCATSGGTTVGSSKSLYRGLMCFSTVSHFNKQSQRTVKILSILARHSGSWAILSHLVRAPTNTALVSFRGRRLGSWRTATSGPSWGKQMACPLMPHPPPAPPPRGVSFTVTRQGRTGAIMRSSRGVSSGRSRCLPKCIPAAMDMGGRRGACPMHACSQDMHSAGNPSRFNNSGWAQYLTPDTSCMHTWGRMAGGMASYHALSSSFNRSTPRVSQEWWLTDWKSSTPHTAHAWISPGVPNISSHPWTASTFWGGPSTSPNNFFLSPPGGRPSRLQQRWATRPSHFVPTNRGRLMRAKCPTWAPPTPPGWERSHS